ncbi:MAG: ligand-binding sensor domain-containing protein/signal transduction histidine kinase [Phenylobacterium sp.]|jgi:ligand-binding sensor domain-containing protein/signal transduction histidine kinase
MWLSFSFLSPPTQAEAMRFERISTAQGLSQITINDVLQDRQGFMWFATQDGLNRYDGYQFKIYRHDNADPYSLPGNWVDCLFEDRSGQLWLGVTSGGLVKFEPQSDRFITYTHDPENPTSITDNFITSISQDLDGDLWLTTRVGGLSRFNIDTETFTNYPHDPADPNSSAAQGHYTVMVDHSNTVWVGTEGGGLSRFNRQNNNFKHFRHDPDDATSLSNDRVYSLFEDRNHSLWVGNLAGGLHRFDAENETFVRYRLPGEPANKRFFISGIFEDSGFKLWINTGTKGLFRFDRTSGDFEGAKYDPLNSLSLSSNKIRSITEDHSGIIWVGTLDNGISKYNPQTTYFQHQSHLFSQFNQHNIWAMLATRAGEIWLGVEDDGLARINPVSGEIAHLTYQTPGTPPAPVVALLEDHAGVVWGGTMGDGLFRFNQADQSFSHFYTDEDNDNSLSSNQRVVALMEDGHHNLWIGTGYGLNRWDSSRRKITRFIHQPDDPLSIGSVVIQTLFEDVEGEIWIGLYDNGLDRFDQASGTFEHFRHDPNNRNSLSSNKVLSIHQSPDGLFWIGTDVGLNQFNAKTKTFSHYGLAQGLSNETVMAVMGDEAGFLWLTTNNGLNRFDPRSETFNVYTVSDGINNSEFSSGSFVVTPSGKMLVGGINGLNAFYPQDIKDDKTEPVIVFTDFLLNNKSLPPMHLRQPGHSDRASYAKFTTVINQTQSLVLNHHDQVFTFEFAALHYANPQQNQYAYQLLGFDNDWVYTDALHRRATYTTMAAGEYEFRVKASNGHNVWGSEHRSIKVTILPAPWRTWWAYSVYIALIGAVIGGFVYLRAKKLAAERKTVMAISESEQQLSLALWGSGDQLWDWDKTRGFVQRKNIISHFAFDVRQPLIGGLNDLSDIIHEDDKASFEQALAAHRCGDKDHFECTYRLQDISGEWRWVLDRGKIVDMDQHGEIQRFTGTLQDIHHTWQAKEALRELNETLEHKVIERTQALQDSIDQLKAAQQQLVEAEKMAALGNLVAGVAHEVNTPLGICITMVSLHLERLKTINQQMASGTVTRKLMNSYFEQTEQSQTLVESNLHRAAELVQSFKKVAVEQTADKLDEIVFHDYLAEAIKNLQSVQPRLADNQVSITLLSQGDWVIKTWPGAWWQLLSNLTENSLDHGFFDLTVGEITINAQLKHNQLSVVYRDNGKGMSKAELDKIYEPFYTTARSRGSKGLGMHIVYNLVVQKLGGSIRCQSAPGQGVEYTIELPL